MRDTGKRLATYQPGLLNIARKNGWGGQGSPMLYVPFGMLSMFSKWPESTPQGASYQFIESTLGKMGLSLTKLARIQPSRTLFDLAASDQHYAEVLEQQQQPPPQPQGQGQGPPRPGQGQPQQPGQQPPKVQPKQQQPKQQQPKQQPGEDEGEGEEDGEGEGEEQQPAPAPKSTPPPKVRIERADAKQVVQQLAQQETEQRKAAEKISHVRFKAQEREESEGEGSHSGGVLDAIHEIPKDLVKTMMAIMQRMVGGFDLNPTPMWDSSELVKRIVTKRTLDPARRHEEGRPAMTMAVDVSGSCEEISAATSAVAAAASLTGEYGVDMLVWKHSNGQITTDSADVDPQHDKWRRKQVQSTWHLRNGKRMSVWPALTPEQQRFGFSSGELPMMRIGAYAVLKAGTPKALSGGNNAEYVLSADMLLIGEPAWVVVYTDTDALHLITQLVEQVRGDTKIAWVDYRTIPNRFSPAHGGTYLTVRKDGLADNRMSRYSENRPNIRGYYAVTGENVSTAMRVPSKPMAAYSPRYVGDTTWIPWWFTSENSYQQHTWVKNIGNHRNGRRLYVIPNCDTLWGVVESMKLIAAPERMKQARDFGVATLSMYTGRGVNLTDTSLPNGMARSFSSIPMETI